MSIFFCALTLADILVSLHSHNVNESINVNNYINNAYKNVPKASIIVALDSTKYYLLYKYYFQYLIYVLRGFPGWHL